MQASNWYIFVVGRNVAESVPRPVKLCLDAHAPLHNAITMATVHVVKAMPPGA
jgi:hypothetical protein